MFLLVTSAAGSEAVWVLVRGVRRFLPCGGDIAADGKAPDVLEHAGEVHQVPAHGCRVLIGELAVVPHRHIGSFDRVAVAGARPDLADPTTIGLRRDRVPDMREGVEGFRRAGFDTVLVTGDDAAAHLAVVEVLPGSVRSPVRDEIVARSSLLADLSQRLGAAASVRDVAEIVTTAGRFALAAEFTNVAVLDASEVHLRMVHSQPLPAEIADRYSIVLLTDDTPLSHAVTTRDPVLIANLDELALLYPHLVDDTIAAGLQATASFPLLRSDRTVAGALGIGWAQPVEFTTIVRSLLTTVVQMCAQALDRSLVGDARNQFLRSLQRALLPTIPARHGLEISAEYLPANTELGFGGDWYDIVPISPSRTALIVGDVCGHGIEAAATMTQIRGAVNSLVRLRSDQLDTLFDDVETVLSREEPSFVATVSVHIIDTNTGEITYVSAGHPPAILMDQHGNATLLEGGRRPVLGIGGAPPEPAHAKFSPGCILLAYTDGLVEHHWHDIDADISALIEVLSPIRHSTTKMIANAVASSIEQANDDIAFTVVRATNA